MTLASDTPEHLFVKYRDETGTWFNVEATSGGGITSDGWIAKNMPMTPESIASGIYLRPLTKKEAIVAMLDALMEFYAQRDQQDRRVALAKFALEHSPRDYFSMLQVSAGYGHMLLRESAGYRSWGEVPENLRPRLKMLHDSVRLWREKAEALGWREPSAETDAGYMERVRRAKAVRKEGGAE